jgi:FSR family fosmidomycin resistance protein-like MFS transporter
VVIAFFISVWGLRSTPFLAIPAVVMAAALAFSLPLKELKRRTAGAARATWRELFASRSDLVMLLRLIFINFCLTVGVRGLSTFLPIYMAAHGAPLTSIGILFTLMLALGAIISVFASTLSRRTGKRALIFVSAAAGAPLALAGYLLFPSLAGSVIIVLAGSVLTFSSPLLILLAQKHSRNSPAVASSLIMGLSWGIAGLAMVPLGSLGELLGIRTMMIIVGAFPLLSLVSCLRISRD